eukprot:GEMP01068587.1.p1 GENE.GEMP01068587.1~~GEMP01068587.1.p1  ORF type:complete len:191 (+),score=41.19 GEMP01068587.1:232-804(+)
MTKSVYDTILEFFFGADGSVEHSDVSSLRSGITEENDKTLKLLHNMQDKLSELDTQMHLTRATWHHYVQDEGGLADTCAKLGSLKQFLLSDEVQNPCHVAQARYAELAGKPKAELAHTTHKPVFGPAICAQRHQLNHLKIEKCHFASDPLACTYLKRILTSPKFENVFAKGGVCDIGAEALFNTPTIAAE